ncbi:MAG: nucleotide sugar dehydrogenase [Deltaproteobacteria bacterium]|nr:nucleotide sugar dehydrogenase [Deltaproteobacteria bacterium]
MRSRGAQVVVVQGLGFVGAAVAAAVSHASDGAGQPLYYVIGVDLPTPQGEWKVSQINDGKTPIVSADASLETLLHEGVHVRGNLSATVDVEVYGLADVIVVDIPLDVKDRFAFAPEAIAIDVEAFTQAIRVIGQRMRDDALVLVETTVPVGTCEGIILPILEAERKQRGLAQPVCLAHAPERVMPGPNYVRSIRQHRRTFSGVDAVAAQRAAAFLASVIDTKTYPLYQLENPSSSELAKLMENSYRAVNIAWIHEWTLLAEHMGIDLFQVIDSIRVRVGTHDNIKSPGFGVGGYCLTKDSLLAQWALHRASNGSMALGMTLDALRINADMPIHTFALLAELLQQRLAERTILVCGVSYLAEVGDTRNSPTELLYDTLVRHGARVIVHDPYVRQWEQRPQVEVAQDLAACLRGDVHGIVWAVPHHGYRAVHPAAMVDALTQPPAIVDAQNILSDETAGFLVEAGCLVAGVGKGHWRRRGYHTRHA